MLSFDQEITCSAEAAAIWTATPKQKLEGGLPDEDSPCPQAGHPCAMHSSVLDFTLLLL